jgi:hypothetical protein
MVARNRQQLEAMLRTKLEMAMNEVAHESLLNMQDATQWFYDGGTPVKYVRTGALGRTPKVTPITSGGNEVSFKAYLDQSGAYNTGKNPTMLDVLNLANYGITGSSVGKLRPTVGARGFWELAEVTIHESLDRTLSRYFR